MFKRLFCWCCVPLLFASILFAAQLSCEQFSRGLPVPTDEKTVLLLYQTMKDVHDVLQLKNIPYWVAAGTLLGAVRHQGIIPWDDDLDIRIDKKLKNEFSQLKQIFEKLGYEMVDRPNGYRICSKNGTQRYRKTKDGHEIRYKYPFMDVCFYEQKGNNIYYNWNKIEQPRQDKGVFIYADELFPLKDYQFGSFSVKGPNNPYNYLTCCYGKDCLDTAFYGHSHGTSSVEKGKIKLSEKDKAPALPTGPLKDTVWQLLASQNTSLNIVKISKDNGEESRFLFKSLNHIFIEAFEKQAEMQLKEEHPEEYAALKNAGHAIKDVLQLRFNKIVETLIAQVGSVNGIYIATVSNDDFGVAGYALFTQDPIDRILQSMIVRENPILQPMVLRKYITSLLCLPSELLTPKDDVDEDAYILSVAVRPAFQKQGLGRKLIFSLLSQCPKIKNIYLLTAASKTNTANQEMYEHLGFVRKGVLVTADNDQKILYGCTCVRKEIFKIGQG